MYLHGNESWIVMAVYMAVFWAFLLVVIVIAVRAIIHPRFPSAAGDKPVAERILEERFARGEIDAEEFESRRRVLGGP